MGIYLLLLTGIFILGTFFKSSIFGDKQGTRLFLDTSFILIFLLCALRSYTVGRDLPGYRMHYLDVVNHPWTNFNYIYFEKGYQLLMKVCAWIGLSWQMYLALVYVIILIPIYMFIKKYSRNAFLSVIVFICYMYFEFNLTSS